MVDLVRTLWYIASARLAHGDSARASALAEETLRADATWESWLGTELALRYLAGVSAVLEDKQELAAAHLQRALVLFERVGTWDLLVEPPDLILATATLLARAGRIGPAAVLLAWADPQLAAPTHDLAAARQRDLIKHALHGHNPPTSELDRDQALRLALDETATLLARPRL
jgi:hypothetical protein